MKIGIIQARPGIGDLCVFLPFIHIISKFFKTKILLITKKRTWAKDILKADPHIEEVLYLDENQKTLNLIKFLKKKKLDKIFIFHFGPRYWLISKISGLKEIYFYGLIKKNVSITKFVKEKIKEWLRLSNIRYNCKIYFPTKYKKNKNKNKIVIGIGGSGKNKKWNIDNYIKLIKILSKKKRKYNFLIAGGKDELKDYKKIKKELPKCNLINLCNLTIKKCLYLIEGSKVYIGNDTGFMHLCGSIGIKSFGIFGDTPSDYCNYNNRIIPLMPGGYVETRQGDGVLDKVFVDDIINNQHFKNLHL